MHDHPTRAADASATHTDRSTIVERPTTVTASRRAEIIAEAHRIRSLVSPDQGARALAEHFGIEILVEDGRLDFLPHGCGLLGILPDDFDEDVVIVVPAGHPPADQDEAVIFSVACYILHRESGKGLIDADPESPAWQRERREAHTEAGLFVDVYLGRED